MTGDASEKIRIRMRITIGKRIRSRTRIKSRTSHPRLANVGFPIDAW
jgi:hypothetical protein